MKLNAKWKCLFACLAISGLSIQTLAKENMAKKLPKQNPIDNYYNLSDSAKLTWKDIDLQPMPMPRHNGVLFEGMLNNEKIAIWVSRVPRKGKNNLKDTPTQEWKKVLAQNKLSAKSVIDRGCESLSKEYVSCQREETKNGKHDSIQMVWNTKSDLVILRFIGLSNKKIMDQVKNKVQLVFNK